MRESWRKDLIALMDRRTAELERLEVHVQFDRYAQTNDIVAESPNVIIVATGRMPDLDWIDGTEHCTSVWDIVTGNVSRSEHVVVYDGTGRHGTVTSAEKMSMDGRDGKLIALDDHLAMEITYVEQVIWKRRT